MKANLTGNKVALRTITPNDASDLFEIYSDAQIMKFASDPVFTSLKMVYSMMKSVEEHEALGISLEWAIVKLATNKVIGTCSLHCFNNTRTSCEVGCLLNANYWRQGVMTEALKLMFAYAKSLGVMHLYADVDKDNYRSIGLFNKLGFKYQGAMFYLSLSDT